MIDPILYEAALFQGLWRLLEADFGVDRLEARVLRDVARMFLHTSRPDGGRAFEMGELHDFFADTLEWIRQPLAKVM